MINPKSVTSYAQYNEDLILLSLLHGVKQGFYVDIGANYPVIDSVTKLFYDRGWSGINIEPIPELHKQLTEDRPRDINLNIGIGSTAGELKFYQNIAIHGHSSFKRSEAGTKNDKIRSYNIKIDTLKNILSKHDVKTIDFLKIDVEGFEKEVIEGNDWDKYRPKVICIEANHRLELWQNILLKNDYHLFISDGLNEYYVAKEANDLTEGFAERIVKLRHRSLDRAQFNAWTEDSEQLIKLTDINQRHFELLQIANKENKHLRRTSNLSLNNKRFLKRVGISIYGLTIDWLKYLLSKTS